MKAIDFAMLALCLGPLVLDHAAGSGPTLWRFGRRRFNSETIKSLIDSGLAVRQGDKVVLANA